ncbi:MAG TPA: HIT family protein [Woeseiaceae bacterium]|nr:HIT family protein [Woeseiaceae bacterium]
MFEAPRHEGCPFCDYLAGKTPCAFVTRGELVSAFLNRAQYELGALLLVPNRHVANILELDEELMLALYVEAQRLAKATIDAFGAVGLNMFQNNGVRAGQTISHLHIHLVPRYPGSEPARIFREQEYPRTAVSVLEERAAELRAALARAGG